MIPIELKIKGMYSYKEEQVINFNELISSQLFGIFGNTGAGKSTIIEAIIYALYGEAERLSGFGSATKDNLINRNSKKMSVEFSFKSTIDGNKVYKIIKNCELSNTGNFRTTKDILCEDINGDLKPIETNIKNILGMDKENFKRAVIIPQGKFTNFISLKPGGRTSMMEDLFDLKKYNLSEKTKIMHQKASEELKIIEGEFNTLKDITEENIKKTEENIIIVKNKLSNINVELSNKEKEYLNIGEIKKLIENISNREKEFNKQKEKESAYKEKKNEVEDYKLCKDMFKGKIEEKNKTEKNIENQVNSLVKLKKEQNDIIKEKENCVNTQKKIEEESEKIKEKVKENEEIKKIIKIKDEENLCNGNKKLLEKIQKEHNEIKNNIENQKKHKENYDIEKKKNTEEIKKIENEIKEIEDINKLHKIYQWIEKKESINKNLIDSNNKIKKEFEKFNDYKSKIINLINKANFYIEGEWNIEEYNYNDIEKFNEIILNIRKTLDEKRIILIKELIPLQFDKELEKMAKSIENGEFCPLCGSIEHPNLYKSNTNNEEKKLKLEENITNIDNIRENINIEGISINNLSEDIISKNKDIEKIQNELAKHKNEFLWIDEFNCDEIDKSKIEADINKNKELSDNRKKLWINIEKIGKDIEKIDNDIMKLETNRENINNNLNKKIIEVESSEKVILSLKEDLTQIDFEFFKDKTKDELEKEIDSRNNKAIEIEEELNKNNQKYEKLEKNINEYSGKIESNENYLKEIRKELENITNEIEKLVEESKYESIKEVENILNKNIDVENELKNIDEYFNQLKNLEDALNEIKQELNEKVEKAEYNYNDENLVENIMKKYNELEEGIKKLKDEIDQEHKNLGELNGRLKDFKQKYKRKKELEKEKEIKEKRDKNLKELKKILGKDFVNYIAEFYLKKLCESANKRFDKLTKHNLNIYYDGDFWIKDKLSGGEKRHITTLSGGQLFQVALSLALALSDIIHQKCKLKEQFFFIDEGFGSLDRESLNIVFETLNSLKQENKIVGVISHIEELQEEIKKHIKVTLDNKKGSVVKYSWEV